MSSAPAGEAGRHLPALDGVRAVAATVVLLTHVGFATGAVQPTVVGALIARLDIGVALFFALSGFLMLRSWIRAGVDGTDALPSIRRYAASRAGRILPAYWIVMTVVLLAEGTRAFGPDLRSELRVDLPEVLIHLVIGQGFSGDYFSSFSQTWSLTTEVTFYLVVPLLGLGVVRLCRRVPQHAAERRAMRIVAVERASLVVVVLGVAVAGWSASSLPGASATLATSLLGHCAWFAAGAWVFVRTQKDGTDALTRIAPDRLFAVAGALLVLAASPLGGNLLFDQPSPWQAAIRELLYTCIAALIVTAAVSPAIDRSAVGRVLSSAPLAWLGTRSYALFLWHLPILFGLLTVLRLDLFEGSFVPIALLTFTVSVAVSDLSWRLVERPILARVHRRRESQQRQS